ncbi:hypothetical protein CBL_04930 [Carabus blaptoides fortunei]
MILEYTKIPQADLVRGKPTFWSLPPASKRFPSLISVLPKEQNYEIPTINYVGVPTIIKKEKGILSGNSGMILLSTRKDLWLNSKYRKHRTKELQESITRVLPHKPEVEDLVIIGKGTESLGRNEPEIEFSTPKVIIKETSTTPLVNNKGAIEASLEVEGNTFNIKDQIQEIRKCYVAVDYDCAFNANVQSKISLKNLGTVTLRYYWKRVLLETDLLGIIPYRPPTFSFAFKKNESKILPEETKMLPIYFQTKRPGIHQETWEMFTEPDVFTSGKLLLILWANAELKNSTTVENRIRERIEEGLKNTIITDTLLDTLKMVRTLTKSDESILSEEPLNEKDIFEASNVYFGVPGSLPFIYHYDEYLVGELKNLYNKLKSDNDPEEWNYQIEDIRRVIEYCEDLEEKNICNDILEQTVDALFKSKMIENVDEYKYSRVYNLLKIAFDTMTERVYELRAMFKIPLIEIYPIVDVEMYLKQEREDIERRAKTYPDIIETDALSKIRQLKTTIVKAPDESKQGKDVPENIVVKPDYMTEYMQDPCPCSVHMYDYNLHNTIHTFVCKIVSKVSKFLEYFETQKLVSQEILKNRIQLGIPVTQIDDNRKSILLQQQQNWKYSTEISETFSFTSEKSERSDSLSNLSNAYSSCYDLRAIRSCLDLNSLQNPYAIHNETEDAVVEETIDINDEKDLEIVKDYVIETEPVQNETNEEKPKFKPKCKCELNK